MTEAYGMPEVKGTYGLYPGPSLQMLLAHPGYQC